MQALQIAVQARVPVLVEGEPGTGKTSYAHALGAALHLPVEVIIASIREPSDFSGLPVIDQSNGTVTLAPPSWARRLYDSGCGIAVFDELNTAPPTVQAALLRVILDHWVGEIRLPEEVSMMAIINPVATSAGGWELAAPLANRFCHLKWSMDPQAWVEGLIAGFPAPQITSLPKKWEESIPSANALVSSYIRHRTTQLLVVPTSDAAQGHAWASPRSWTMAARLLAACTSVGLPLQHETTMKLVAGCVGEAITLEFLNWATELDLPDPEELLKHPETLKMPVRSDRAYAVLASVSAVVIANNTVERWNAAWKVIARAIDQRHPDIAAAAGSTLAHNKPTGARTPMEIEKLMPLLIASGALPSR